MHRLAHFVVIGALAACAPSAPKQAAEKPSVAAPAKTGFDAMDESDDVAAWAMWTAGRRDEAIEVFADIVRKIRLIPVAKNSVPVVRKGARCEAVSADGTRGVAVMTAGRSGVYWFDEAGTLLKYEPARASEAVALTQALFALNADGLTIVDGRTLAHVLHVPDAVYGTSASGRTVVYQEHSTKGHPKLHVWDAATRRDRRVIQVPDGEACSHNIVVSPDEEAFSCSLEFKEVMTAEGQSIENNLAIFDAGSPRLVFPAPSEFGAPSYSRHRKWIAYAHGNEIVLVDRTTHKFHARPLQGSLTLTRFTNSGRLLIVGTGLELAILEVPSLKLVATTPEVRPPAPGSADLDLISDIEIIGDDRAVWARAEEGGAAFRLPSGTLDPSVQTPAAAPTRAEAAITKMETVLDTTVCTAYDRVYPIAACGRAYP